MKTNLKIILILGVGIILGISISLTISSFSKDKMKKDIKDIETKLETPVNYFEKINHSNDTNAIKDGFINIVDFIFYNGNINGYTFDELNDAAKLKIMKIAFSIDNKIDKYFPDYKEIISYNTKKMYNNVKLYLVELYLNTTTKICENNNELCEHAKDDFKAMKKSFGITWELIKDITGNTLDKLKDWYEIFRSE